MLPQKRFSELFFGRLGKRVCHVHCDKRHLRLTSFHLWRHPLWSLRWMAWGMVWCPNEGTTSEVLWNLLKKRWILTVVMSCRVYVTVLLQQYVSTPMSSIMSVRSTATGQRTRHSYRKVQGTTSLGNAENSILCTSNNKDFISHLSCFPRSAVSETWFVSIIVILEHFLFAANLLLRHKTSQWYDGASQG